MGSLIFDNTNSDGNLVAAINEVHDAFRSRIRQNCANYVIKFKWIQKLCRDEALTSYLKAATESGTMDGWAKLVIKLEKEIKREFSEKCDDWMLGSLAIFKLEDEIKKAFELEWDLVGPKPENLL